jgi:multisubunit Na+/H+ antiporter MnhE subunit
MNSSGVNVAKRGKVGRHKSERRPGQAIELTVVALLLAAGWIGLVSSTKLHEMVVGAAVVALLTAFAARVLRADSLNLRVGPRDLLQGWRIPWYILTGCWEITLLFLRDLAGKRTHSYYRACSFRTSNRDPILIGRSVLAVAYTTAAPNFIVIGIDDKQDQMLFHQLQRSSVPKMSQALGAQMEQWP